MKKHSTSGMPLAILTIIVPNHGSKTQIHMSIIKRQPHKKRYYRHFSKEDILMTNKHKIRFLTPLAIKETQTKTTRYHFTPTRISVVRKPPQR
jgi:hypothetical protein